MTKKETILFYLLPIVYTIATISNNDKSYDYIIELNRDSITIDTKHGDHYIFHADSISIDKWIIADNI